MIGEDEKTESRDRIAVKRLDGGEILLVRSESRWPSTSIVETQAFSFISHVSQYKEGCVHIHLISQEIMNTEKHALKCCPITNYANKKLGNNHKGAAHSHTDTLQ